MTDENKEKPDWLSEFQNNQATSGKQTTNERENDGITLDIYGPVITNASPRYGRRSISGIKSVENSPKKGSLGERKSVNARSSSARPALLNKNVSQNEYNIKEDQTAENFSSFLESAQNHLRKFSINNLSESLENISYPGLENLLQSQKNNKNLEDSWNSLSIFNIRHKGRLGSTENFFSAKDKFTNDNYEKHQQVLEENLLGDDTFHSTGNKIPENGKSKPKAENLGEVRKKYENGSSKINDSKRDTKDFIIPELPQGKILVFNIKTTWGDKHYLGLNGIEIFNSKGKKVQVKMISADPPNINILPEYSRDPRVVENLIDDVYLTQDDVHMWLAPFTPNSSHLIFIEFYEVEELSMLRIWNYNKSRIHCFRGAKDVEIKLDDTLIFIGEIAKASGEILNTLNCLGDTILFTTDDEILELVAQNDEYFSYSTLCHFEDNQTTHEEFRPLTGRNKEKQVRPFTCPKNSSAINNMLHSYSTQVEKHQRKSSNKLLNETKNFDGLDIPDNELEKQFNLGVGETSQLKSAISLEVTKTQESSEGISTDMKTEEVTLGLIEKGNGEQAETVLTTEKSLAYEFESHSPNEKSEFLDKIYTLYLPSASFLSSESTYETISMPTGYNFTIQIHSTWGDLYYVGLNGLQIFDENNTEIKMHPDNISADPESVNVLDEIENDARTPDKLIDGVNDSVDAYHMWLAPVLPLTINRIDLTFQNPVTLSSLKLWNYAKTPSRGVREFGILVDGLLIYNGELDQAVIAPDLDSPRVPCKTVHFYNSNRFQNIKNSVNEDSSVGTLLSADQSQRPLTTMTSHS